MRRLPLTTKPTKLITIPFMPPYPLVIQSIQGFRHLLGVSVTLSEAKAHWRSFLEALLSRAMQGVKLIISEAHSGLKAAKAALLLSVPWQRCHSHLQQNVQNHMPTLGLKKSVGEAVRSMLTAPDLETAKQLFNKAVKPYEEKAPALAAWLKKNMPRDFVPFSFPSAYYREIRTNHMLERANRKIKRRTQGWSPMNLPVYA